MSLRSSGEKVSIFFSPEYPAGEGGGFRPPASPRDVSR